MSDTWLYPPSLLQSHSQTTPSHMWAGHETRSSLYILQVTKNWRWEWPGNEATALPWSYTQFPFQCHRMEVWKTSWDYPISYCVHVHIYKDGRSTDMYCSNSHKGGSQGNHSNNVTKLTKRKLRNNFTLLIKYSTRVFPYDTIYVHM